MVRFTIQLHSILFLVLLVFLGTVDYQPKKQESCPIAMAFPGKCPFSGATSEFKIRPQEPKYLRLKNWVEDTQAVDTLHQKAANVSENRASKNNACSAG